MENKCPNCKREMIRRRSPCPDYQKCGNTCAVYHFKYECIDCPGKPVEKVCPTCGHCPTCGATKKPEAHWNGYVTVPNKALENITLTPSSGGSGGMTDDPRPKQFYTY